MKVVMLSPREYDGSQLHHAYAYEEQGVLGPTICAFRGPANVKDHLVDLEDSLADDFIKSEEMWHFIIELPDTTIDAAVALQRLFICQIMDYLRSLAPAHRYERKGDDIMVDGKKLSVSIATLSRFSALIHVGINITVGDNCPVAAIGLNDFLAYTAERKVGLNLPQIFAEEYNDIKEATYKVTEV